MVLVFYLLCIILMMLIRPILNVNYLKNGKDAVYSALYFIPILALFHTVVGGLICMRSVLFCVKNVFMVEPLTAMFYENIILISDYAFPYLSIIISMISNAVHFSMKLDQSMKSLFKTSMTEMKNTTIIRKSVGSHFSHRTWTEYYARTFCSWTLADTGVWNKFIDGQ